MIKKIFLALGCLFSPTLLLPDNIIFDMNGVLVHTQPLRTAWEIGLSRFLGNFNPAHIQDTFYDFLNSIMPHDLSMPKIVNNGRILPQIMCEWLAGTKNSVEIRELVNTKITELAPGIDSERKVQLLREISNCIFTPERFVKAVVPIKKGVRILKKCYRQVDAQGNRKHKIFIITNWAADSFMCLYNNKSIRKFLELADGIVVSGAVHLLKPSKEILDYSFDYFGIDPDNIDDEPLNVQSARMLGKKKLKAIHCENFNFEAVDKTLHRLGVY